MGRRQVDGFLLRLPLFGELICKTSVAQFARTLGSMSRSGVPILQALEVMRDNTSNRVIGDAIGATRSEVAEGSLSASPWPARTCFPTWR